MNDPCLTIALPLYTSDDKALCLKAINTCITFYVFYPSIVMQILLIQMIVLKSYIYNSFISMHNKFVCVSFAKLHFCQKIPV